VCVWITQGHFSVVFFIVLSGFSIVLPVARPGDGKLNGGFSSYVYLLVVVPVTIVVA